MNKIEQRLREIHEKWKHSNQEVSDACRDGAEELRVMSVHLDAANRELEIYRELNKPKFIPDQFMPIGWGKGKDE